MKILDFKQGSPEWKAARLEYFTASEATIMMDASPYMSRDDLLAYKTTKVEAEVTRFQQIIFDNGHDVEAAARPLLEADIGEDLYPVVGVIDYDGLPLLASLDGNTMIGDIIFEHKNWNEEKVKKMQEAGDLLPEYYWQVEQELGVSGASQCIFVMSDGTKDKWFEFRYTSHEDRFQNVIAGWKQFAIDLDGYQPKEYAAKPQAAPVLSLPAIYVDIVGEVKQSNLAVYRANAEALIASVKTNLETDQDFADAEALVKKFDEAEKALESAKSQALAKTSSIDELFREVDYLKDLFRTKRLEVNKLVESEKAAKRKNIVITASLALAEHKQLADTSVGFPLPAVAHDFNNAIKGKRTMKSLTEAANDELARAKIEINQMLQKVVANRAVFDELAVGNEMLFPDTNSLLLKDQADMIATIKSRIAEHKADIDKKAADALAAKEAAAKLEAEKAAAPAPTQPAPVNGQDSQLCYSGPSMPPPTVTAQQQPQQVTGGPPGQTGKINQHGVNMTFVSARLIAINNQLPATDYPGLLLALENLIYDVTQQMEQQQ